MTKTARAKKTDPVTPLAKPIKYSIAVPGSKSLMNRALICAALGKGKSVLRNPIYCDDTNYMMNALEKLGVRIVKKPNAVWIYGKGGKFTSPQRPLHLGNAGTTTRFLIPLVPAGTIVTGNKHMQKRPLTDLLKALETLGYIYETETGCPPVKIVSRNQATSTITIKGTMSSQYISALLMLAPTLQKRLTINVSGTLVSKPYVAMTLQVMKEFGIKVTNKNFKQFTIQPQTYTPTTYEVEGDASSATYWWALAAISGSTITVTNVPEDTLQPDRDILRVLEKMDCRVEGNTVIGPVTSPNAVEVSMRHMPDAVMSVAMVAVCARGTTVLKQIAHLAIKETNRLTVLADNLKNLGVKVKVTKDRIEITGQPKKWKRGVIATHDDHRFAMAFGILGLVQPGITIDTPACVRKSYPTFWNDLRSIQRHSKDQTIVLTGMRGSGKSTLAKHLAKKYTATLIDLDNEIEKELGMTINQFIDKNPSTGWKGFRKVERELTKKFSNQKNTIIATGGGTLMFDENYAIIKHNYIVFLNSPLAVLKKRLVQDSNKRPALLHDTLKELGSIWQERKSQYYFVADQIFDMYYVHKDDRSYFN